MYSDDNNIFFSSYRIITSKEEINDNESLKIENTYEVKNDFEETKKELDAKLKKSKSLLLLIVSKFFKRLRKVNECEFYKIS